MRVCTGFYLFEDVFEIGIDGVIKTPEQSFCTPRAYPQWLQSGGARRCLAKILPQPRKTPDCGLDGFPRYTHVVLEPIQIAASVRRLLEEIRGASNLLLTLVKARGGIGLDLQARLEQITWSLLELVELQAKYRDEVREIVPNFALQLRYANEAVSEAGAAIDHRKRPDLDEMAQAANHLLRTLDESPAYHHSTASH
jgi:hypothetical protein